LPPLPAQTWERADHPDALPDEAGSHLLRGAPRTDYPESFAGEAPVRRGMNEK